MYPRNSTDFSWKAHLDNFANSLFSHNRCKTSLTWSTCSSFLLRRRKNQHTTTSSISLKISVIMDRKTAGAFAEPRWILRFSHVLQFRYSLGCLNCSFWRNESFFDLGCNKLANNDDLLNYLARFDSIYLNMQYAGSCRLKVALTVFTI